MNAPRICAITGSNGYVGGGIKNHFIARGWEILELVRRPTGGARAAKFQLGDEITPSALAGVNALVHCAYDFKPLRQNEIHTVNIEGSRKLFQTAKIAGVEKIIFISSISAYPGCRSLYGQAKLAIEKIALEQGALVIRPGLVYGNGPGGMFGKLTTQVRQSTIIPMIGGGSQIQYLVHQEDLSNFIEDCASRAGRISPRILTAANEQPWAFKRLLQEIARALGKNPKFVPLPWRLVWAGLKSAELCGVRLNFRSDSLVSLMYQNPNPDFSLNAEAGLICRPFEITQLSL
ncbi:MAG TPA: NAD-dependent epimerase/dehydratase family protein [Verrucomicrobiae bacterium]|jgi:nucleoside-diphosphate-sugar epimerase